MSAITEYEACCVVDQFCERPANIDISDLEFDEIKELCRSLPECFSCGLGVCLECSSRRKYMHHGLKRLCNNCQEEYDGTPYFVIIRMALKAGIDRSRAVLEAKSYKTPKQAREEAERQKREQKEWLKKLAELERTGPWSKNSTCGACGGTGRRKKGKLP